MYQLITETYVSIMAVWCRAHGYLSSALKVSFILI